MAHCPGQRCPKASRPWRYLAMTPGINRRPTAGGGIDCAEGDSGPPRDGREPRWARPCEASGALFLSNGGSGGGHETCTLWPPPAPFGYFPVMESTSPARRRAKPPTRNKHLAEGRKRGYLFPHSTEGFASAEATKGLSGRPLETFGPLAASRNLYIKRFPCSRQEKGLPILPRIAKDFASAEATRGFPVAPWTPSGAPYRWGSGLCFAV